MPDRRHCPATRLRRSGGPPSVLLLASASPQRRAILTQVGIAFDVRPAQVEELTAGDPRELALENARRKALAVPSPLTLGADTDVALDGEILGKPADAEDATRRWERMRGRSGVLHTGHCLIDSGTGRELVRAERTVVRFAQVTDEEIDAYVATGEPLQVAGAFTIDGLGGAFVDGVEGDPHTVVGISLPLLRRMFAELGVRWTDLWKSCAAGS